MQYKAQEPLIYLITSGRTTAATTRASSEYRYLIRLIDAAVKARIPLLQIREKRLTDRTLYELSVEAATLTSGSVTRLLINNRADVASGAGADGVHLTTSSIRASVMRKTFGDEFLIGASTHSLEEAKEAYEGGADFVVFGPVFETESKSRFGEPVGVMKLNEVITQVDRIPILALGGISQRNAEDCFRAGAHGVAAISLLSDPDRLAETIATLNQTFAKVRND